MTVNRLKIACIKRGVKMDALAKHFGINKSALSRYSTGKRHFPPDLLQRIAEFLGCEPEQLLPDDSDEDELKIA